MGRFRFRNFKVYQDAILFRSSIKILATKYFPSHERFVLTDQILRAATSIVLNIAEGTDRGTDKDFALFLNRSHTSLNEVVACLDLALKEKCINQKIHDEYLNRAEELANQITAFRRKLLINPSK